MAWIVVGAVVLLAWVNGSNDNFKGVATLYGSRTTSYRKALALATVTTLAGSLAAPWLASGLLKAFSAKGLVPDVVAASPAFLGAAALGAALTVLCATLLGLPVSTTHGLTGALIGAGLLAGHGVNFGLLSRSFVLPLLLSPALAIVVTLVLYRLAGGAGRRLGLARASCVCLAETSAQGALAAGGWTALSAPARRNLGLVVSRDCALHAGGALGISAATVLDGVHFLSAGAVCFARGLNDTPKILAFLLGAKALGMDLGLSSIALAMAIGGLLGARRVAETLSQKIVALDEAQGCIANVTTAGLVIAASRYGLPVSTTHVATGGLFGIAATRGEARWKMIGAILTAWLATLPLGAALGALAFLLLRTHA